MPKQIDLFLDSSAIRDMGPSSALITSLKVLVKKGSVIVHVPWLVEREVATGVADDSGRGLSKDLMRSLRWALSAGDAGKWKALIDGIEEFRRRKDDIISEGLANWLNGVKAVRHKPTGEDAEKVFDGYFQGHPPFGSRKNRADIPDGFVHQTLASFCKDTKGDTHVIVSDRRLSEACKLIPGVAKVHASLLDFLTLTVTSESKSNAEFSSYVSANGGQIDHHVKETLPFEIIGTAIHSDLVPKGVLDARIASVGTVGKLEIGTKNIRLIGDDVAVVPFKCIVESTPVEMEMERGHLAEFKDTPTGNMFVQDFHYDDLHISVVVHMDLEVAGRMTFGIRKVSPGSFELHKPELDGIDALDVIGLSK